MILLAVQIIVGLAIWGIGAIVVAQYINKDIEHERSNGRQHNLYDWTSDASTTMPVILWPIWPILKYSWRLLVFLYKFPKRLGEWLWLKKHYAELVEEELRHGL